MKVLVFSTVYPNTNQPVHGLFVAERTRHAARLAEISVISPVAWFRRAPQGTIEPSDSRVVAVEHPRAYYVPGAFKSLDGLFLFLSALPAVRRLKRRFDFDLIDAHFGYPDGVAAIFLGHWFRRPVTITLRGSEIDMAQYRLRRAVLGWALRRADRVITVSNELADLALDLGTAKERIRVIGNGVDLERFRPTDRDSARRALGLPASATLLVSVGHLARVKRFDLVLRVLPDIVRDHPGVRFVIVGGAARSSGAYPQELARVIAQHGLADRVSITGAVTPDRVALWLSAADLFVLASEREGSPNALREAVACGCPVVVGDVGDAAQIVSERTGLLVRGRSNLEEWRQTLSTALRISWNRAAIRTDAERHSWEGVVSRVKTEWEASTEQRAAGLRARASVR